MKIEPSNFSHIDTIETTDEIWKHIENIAYYWNNSIIEGLDLFPYILSTAIVGIILSILCTLIYNQFTISNPSIWDKQVEYCAQGKLVNCAASISYYYNISGDNEVGYNSRILQLRRTYTNATGTKIQFYHEKPNKDEE